MTSTPLPEQGGFNELRELCKQVFEKTGWIMDNGQLIPFYTSDYLLEKLPHAIENDENPHGDNWLSLTNTDSLWCASYEEDVTLKGKYFAGCYDDTPLKALLKLTIALHEAGELKGDTHGTK